MKTDQRIRSIDVFRGITIFMMIFVNDLTSVKEITMWLKHMPMDKSGMTIPDVVFPAFLFIVGMSIPLAFKKRINSGESKINLIKHIVIRSGALLILGVLMVNTGRYNPELSILSRSMWSFLLYLSIILVWNITDDKNESGQKLFKIMKWIGVSLLLFVVLTFRAGTAENTLWLATSWWGILGLIGWAYLISSLCYLAAKGSRTALLLAVAMFTLIYIGDQNGAFDFLLFNKGFLLIGPHLAGHAAITSLGVLLTMIFEPEGFLTNHKDKLKKSLLMIVMLIMAGYCIEPLFGINKIKTTPAFVFYSSAICVALFIILYYLIDIKKVQKVFNIFNPAGSNPLLAFILPSIIYSLVSLLGISSYLGFWRAGGMGIIRSLIFTLLVVGITNILTRYNIRLKL